MAGCRQSLLALKENVHAVPPFADWGVGFARAYIGLAAMFGFDSLISAGFVALAAALTARWALLLETGLAAAESP